MIKNVPILLLALLVNLPLQAAEPGLPPAFVKQGAPQDFDFEIGRWNTQLKRLTNPLSGQPAKSADGGKTWEVNWIAVDTRVR